jgi:hypothetical protein
MFVCHFLLQLLALVTERLLLDLVRTHLGLHGVKVTGAYLLQVVVGGAEFAQRGRRAMPHVLKLGIRQLVVWDVL